MNILTACCSTLMVGTLVLSGLQNGQAQTAEDILNKADAIYSGATSYQATYHWEEKSLGRHGHPVSIESSMVEVKTNGTTKFVRHEISDLPKEQKEDGIHLTGTWDKYDDGKDGYFYNWGDDYYYRNMHEDLAFSAEDNTEMLYTIMPRLKPREGFTYTLRKSANVNGKAAYVIEAKGAVEHSSTVLYRWVTVKGHRMEVASLTKPETEKIDELLYIEQATFHLLQMKAKSTRPDYTTRITQIIKSEVLNAPLPDSTFVFVAPEGVTDLEIKKSGK